MHLTLSDQKSISLSRLPFGGLTYIMMRKTFLHSEDYSNHLSIVADSRFPREKSASRLLILSDELSSLTNLRRIKKQTRDLPTTSIGFVCVSSLCNVDTEHVKFPDKSGPSLVMCNSLWKQLHFLSKVCRWSSFTLFFKSPKLWGRVSVAEIIIKLL